MNIYELITPSDPITFKTDDDKVAFACALLLGNGKAGCNNITTGESLNTMLAFAAEPEKIITEIIGGDLGDFMEANLQKLADCYESFAYTTPSERKEYDDACEAITDAEERQKFKDKHENDNRSSMSKWVLGAWSYGIQFKEKALNAAS